MPDPIIRIYDGGWFRVEWTSRPTKRNQKGCDGIYIQKVWITDWPGAIAEWARLGLYVPEAGCPVHDPEDDNA